MNTANQNTVMSGLLNQSNGQMHYYADVELFSQSCGSPSFTGIEVERVKMKTKDLYGVKPRLPMKSGLLLLLLLVAVVSDIWAQVGTLTQTGDQTVCITGIPEPYGVIPTPGSTYSWTVDNETTSPGWTLVSTGTNLASILWITPGTYTVRVVETITATECIGATVAINVTVEPVPTVTVNSSTVCQGSPATITATPGTPGTYNYVWTVPAGVTDPGNVATFTSAVAGTYSAVITNTATTCVSALASGTVTVDPLITVTVNSPAVCQGMPATITATPGTPGTYNYIWTVPAGVTDPGNVATFTSAVAGTYSVVITSTTGTCVSAPTSGTVAINPLPTPDITGPDPVCESVDGSTEIYSTTNVSGNTYNWTVVGGTFTGQGTNQIAVIWTTPGAGSVSVTETIESTGCNATDTTNITIQPAPATSPIYHD
jgi:hypothetical protein